MSDNLKMIFCGVIGAVIAFLLVTAFAKQKVAIEKKMRCLFYLFEIVFAGLACLTISVLCSTEYVDTLFQGLALGTFVAGGFLSERWYKNSFLDE
jgi:hypothetical protein